jgi:hypothetical protein
MHRAEHRPTSGLLRPLVKSVVQKERYLIDFHEVTKRSNCVHRGQPSDTTTLDEFMPVFSTDLSTETVDI